MYRDFQPQLKCVSTLPNKTWKLQVCYNFSDIFVVNKSSKFIYVAINSVTQKSNTLKTSAHVSACGRTWQMKIHLVVCHSHPHLHTNFGPLMLMKTATIFVTITSEFSHLTWIVFLQYLIKHKQWKMHLFNKTLYVALWENMQIQTSAYSWNDYCVQDYQEMKQSIQRSIMYRISIYQVCCGFSQQFDMSTMEVCRWQAWNESQWTVLLGHTTISIMIAAIKHIAAKIIFLMKTAHHCIVHETQSNCCSKKVSISLVLSYAPNNPVLNPIYYKISRFILSQQDWKNKQPLAVLESSNNVFEWKCVISVILCFTRQCINIL